MGASGKSPASMHRDLLGLVGETCITRAWRSTSLFFKIGMGLLLWRRKLVSSSLMSCSLPSLRHPQEQVLLGGDASNLKSFWKTCNQVLSWPLGEHNSLQYWTTPLLESLPWRSLLGRSSMKSPDSFGTSAAPKRSLKVEGLGSTWSVLWRQKPTHNKTWLAAHPSPPTLHSYLIKHILSLHLKRLLCRQLFVVEV